jgi:hypothetical protein
VQRTVPVVGEAEQDSRNAHRSTGEQRRDNRNARRSTGEHAVPRAQKHRVEPRTAIRRRAAPRARQRSAGTTDPRSAGEQLLARGRGAHRSAWRIRDPQASSFSRAAEERTGTRDSSARRPDPQRRVGAEQPRRWTRAQGGRIRDGGG